MPNIPPSTRDGWIDLLRAVSAVSVVLFHFNSLPTPLPPDSTLAAAWHRFWGFGHLGVGVFFALSGFCFVPGWHRSARFPDFLRRRAWRLLPPYWCSLLLVAALALGVRLVTGVNDVASFPRAPGAIAATLLLLTEPVTSVPTVNWVYWTLSYVLAFQLLAGLVLLLPRAGRFPALAVLHVAICLGDMLFRPAPAGPLFFCLHWPVFGLGVALAVLPLDRRTGVIMLGMSAIHAAWAIGTSADETHYVAAGVGTVAFLALSRSLPFPSLLRPVARVGVISYSLYLIHVPVAIHGFMRLMPDRHSSGAALVTGQLLLLAVAIGVTRLFYLIAERPFQSARPAAPASA